MSSIRGAVALAADALLAGEGVMGGQACGGSGTAGGAAGDAVYIRVAAAMSSGSRTEGGEAVGTPVFITEVTP